MKRLLFLALLLSATFTFGCPPPAKNDNNANAANAGNANANRATRQTNTDEGFAVLRDKNDKAVAVVVYYDKDKKKQILVSPDPIRMWRKNNNKLRFFAFNDLDVDISGITFTFATDPFDGTDNFDIANITAGNDGGGKTRKVKDEAGLDGKSFKYKIEVTLSNGEKVTLDPQVEVVGASNE